MRRERGLAGAAFLLCDGDDSGCHAPSPRDVLLRRKIISHRAPRGGHNRVPARTLCSDARFGLRETMTIRLTDKDVAEAARLLRAGALVAFPTETVYGLGGDATNEHAVAAIFAAKGTAALQSAHRPCRRRGRRRTLAVFDARARTLAARFWPGPLSLVLQRRDRLPGVAARERRARHARAARAGAPPRARPHPRRRPCRLRRRAPTAPAGSARPRPSMSPPNSTAASPRSSMAAHAAVGIEFDRARSRRTGGAAAAPRRRAARGADRGDRRRSSAWPMPAWRRRSPGMLASHYAPALKLRLEARTVAAGRGAARLRARRAPGAARSRVARARAAISPRPPPISSPRCARSTGRNSPPSR